MLLLTVCVCFRVHSKRQQAQSINISKHPSKPTCINLNTTIHTYIKIKCSIPPHIDRCVHIPKHVSGLLISLWEPANSLFVRNKYVTPTGKRLHAGYVQKAEARKNIPFDTTARNKQHVRVVQ